MPSNAAPSLTTLGIAGASLGTSGSFRDRVALRSSGKGVACSLLVKAACVFSLAAMSFILI